MPVVECPACGEEEDLTGERKTAEDGADRLLLTCGVCAASWDRDTIPRCRLCSEADLEAIPTATLQERGRGDQWAPSGIRLAYYCWGCGGRDVTSSAPTPGPTPPPGDSRNLRALRRRGNAGG